MWQILNHDVRLGSPGVISVALTFSALLGGVWGLVALISGYCSPYWLCPPLAGLLILAMRVLARREPWKRAGRMPPLQPCDMRRVRERCLGRKPTRSYERRLCSNASRHRGLARV